MGESADNMRIAIYGAGKLANTFLDWLDFRNIDLTIVSFLQTEATQDTFRGYKVTSCDLLSEDLDYIVLAVSEKYQQEIFDYIGSHAMIEGIIEKTITIEAFKNILGYEKDNWSELHIDYLKEKLVHVGTDYDGYYIDKYRLKKVPVVLSFGIGEDVSFDLGMIKEFNATVYAFDPTPKSISYMEQYKNQERLVFIPEGIAERDGKEYFYLPSNDEYVSGAIAFREGLKEHGIEVTVKSFGTIVKEIAIDDIDVLKMDIEGTEFDILPKLLDLKCNIDQILVETHERFYKDGNYKLNILLDDFYRHGYEIAHYDDNDFTFTFVKREKV